MKPVSIAIIAHNEERFLPDTLASVSWADQVVVVNCGSTDRTGDIAREAGADVFDEPNRPNLNVNKNIAIDKCRNEWVIVLDADEHIPPDLRSEIESILENPVHNGYFFPRKNFVLGKWVRHGAQYPDWQLRLIRKSKARFPAKHVHERIRVEGTVGRTKQAFDHFPFPTLADLMRKASFYAEFEAQYLHDKGTKFTTGSLLWYAGVKLSIRFVRKYFFKGGFLDGIPGLVLVYFDIFNKFIRWIRLWEIQQQPQDNR